LIRGGAGSDGFFIASVYVVIPLALAKDGTARGTTRNLLFTIRLRLYFIFACHPHLAVIQRSAATKDPSSI